MARSPCFWPAWCCARSCWEGHRRAENTQDGVQQGGAFAPLLFPVPSSYDPGSRGWITQPRWLTLRCGRGGGIGTNRLPAPSCLQPEPSGTGREKARPEPRTPALSSAADRPSVSHQRPWDGSGASPAPGGRCRRAVWSLGGSHALEPRAEEASGSVPPRRGPNPGTRAASCQPALGRSWGGRFGLDSPEFCVPKRNGKSWFYVRNYFRRWIKKERNFLRKQSHNPNKICWQATPPPGHRRRSRCVLTTAGLVRAGLKDNFRCL